MKPLKLVPFCLLILLVSCSPDVIQIGKLNMISNRNINPGNEAYVMISAYQGASKRDIKKTRHKTIEDAVDATVRQVPGGEFLTNVKVYMVNGEYFMVEGDVWGKEAGKGVVTETIKGFKVGDRVQFKQQMGTIISIIDAKECLVQLDGNSYGTKLEYEKIIKIDLNTQPNNSDNNSDNNSNNNNSNNNNSNNNNSNNNNSNNNNSNNNNSNNNNSNNNNSNNNANSNTNKDYKVGDQVKYLSKRFIPAEYVTGKIVKFSDDNKTVEMEYFTNQGKPKIEIVPIESLQ